MGKYFNLLTLLSNSCEWQWWWQWWQWWWRWRWWWQWCLSFNLLRLTFEGNSTAGSHTEPSILQNHLYFMAALILSSAVLKKRNTNKHNVVKIKSCIGSCVMMMRNTETDDVTAFSVPRRELPNYWPGIFWEHSRGLIPVPISVIAFRRRSSSHNGNRKQDLPIMAIGNKMPLKRVHILFLY